MDLAIAIGIWIAGFGMSLVGIEMTIHPPNDKTNAKYWYRGIFIVLGVLFLGFNICQFVRGQADAKHRDQQHEKEELRHEGETKFTQGQLDAIAKVMERLSSSDAGNKPVAVRELAAAISSIVQHDNRPQSIPPASAPYSDWPTAKLRDEVKKLA